MMLFHEWMLKNDNDSSYQYDTPDAFHVGTFFWVHSERFSKKVFEKEDYLRFLNSRRGRQFDIGEQKAFEKLWTDWRKQAYTFTGIERWCESSVKRFLDHCCKESNTDRLRLKLAYEAYLDYCVSEILPPLTKRKFRDEVDFAGFTYDGCDWAFDRLTLK